MVRRDVARFVPVLRRVIGPATVAGFTAIQLREFGLFVAAAGAWTTFVLAEIAVGAWSALQMRRARTRLDEARRARSRRSSG
jgi:membrane protein DedA with SNARE-associated domain